MRIAISEPAFEAIAQTLALGSVGYENHVNERGERYVWLPPNVIERLKAAPTRRGPQRRDPADRGPEIGGRADGEDADSVREIAQE
jgi:hypothetical protein